MLFFHTGYFFLILLIFVLFIAYHTFSAIRIIQTEKFFKTYTTNGMDIKITAKKLYPINYFARLLLIKFLNDYKHKSSENKYVVNPCLKVFNIDETVFNQMTVHDLKVRWKELVKKNHPDKFQDEKEKVAQTIMVSELNNCKDNLLQIIERRL